MDALLFHLKSTRSAQYYTRELSTLASGVRYER